MTDQTSFRKYRFLLFDADRTLLDFDADMTAAFQSLYESCGFSERIPYSPAMLEAYEVCNTRWWDKFEKQECTKPELFRNRFVDFLAETGLSGDPDEMNRLYFTFLGQGGAVYPGALELVKKLSEDFSLYLITNGNAVSQRTRLERSGLLPYLRDVFVSDAVGVGKPDPRYFQYVFDHIPGFEKERAVVIGDSLTSDMQGAVNAGLDSIWYTGAWQDASGSVPYTYQAKSYQEILELLYRL